MGFTIIRAYEGTKVLLCEVGRIIIMNDMDIRYDAQNIKRGVQNEQYRHRLNNKSSRELYHTNNFFAPSIASHAYSAFMSFFAVEFPI